MTDTSDFSSIIGKKISRRGALKGLGATAAGIVAGPIITGPGFVRYAQAQSSAPIKIGFQAHRTGIGAAYGRWYEKTTVAAIKAINDAGGITGRPVEVIVEDDGTDPGRGAEVVGKFATQHKVDVAYGTLFSHVVIGSAPAAGEFKLPYFVVSEGHHVASTKLNRYVFQPGITDVKSQIQAMAPWIAANAGKKVCQIFPDFAFGYDHRDYLPPALKAQGADVVAQIAIPPTESSFTKYFPQIPADTDVIYHVMVGTGGAHLRQGTRRVLRLQPAATLRLHRQPRGGRHQQPRPRIPRRQPFLGGITALCAARRHRRAEGLSRGGRHRRQRRVGRRRQGRVDGGAHVRLLGDALRHQEGDGGCRLQGAGGSRQACRGDRGADRVRGGAGAPAGRKNLQRQDPPVFGIQNISKVEGGKLKVVHKTKIEDGLYEPEGDYTTQPL